MADRVILAIGPYPVLVPATDTSLVAVCYGSDSPRQKAAPSCAERLLGALLIPELEWLVRVEPGQGSLLDRC